MIIGKAGQPVKMDSGKRGRNVSFYVDTEEMKALEDIRWREHKSMSEVVRLAIQEYVRLHGEGNDTFKLDAWSKETDFQAIPNIFAEDNKIKQDYSSANQQDRTRRRVAVSKMLRIYDEVDGRKPRKLSAFQEYEATKKLLK